MKKLFLATTALTALAAAPAHAGPVAAAVSWIGSTLAAGGIGAALLRTAIGIGASLLAQALAPKPDMPEMSVKFDVQWGDDKPLSFIAGDYVTAGKRKYIGSWGKDTRFITDVIEVSGLPQPGLVGMWVDDEEATFTGKIWGIDPNDDPSGFSDQGEYDPGSLPAGWISAGRAVSNYSDDGNRIYVKYIDGTQIAADPFLTMVFGSDPDYPWTADMVGTGKSYAIVTTRYDDDTLTSYPAYLFQPGALPMYDIRKDDTAGGVGAHRWGQTETYEPSRNPAVIAYNIIRGISFGSEWVFGGKNLSAWRLPAAEWMAAANECDAPVNLDGGGTEPAYRCGMEIDVSMTPADVLEEIGKAANMHFAEVGGMIKPIVGLPGAAAMSITDDSIIITEGQSFKPFNPVSDTFNALSATYPEPGEKWTTKDSPEFIDTDATAADGGRYLPTSVSYPAAPYGKQVQRLQRAQMQDFRRFRRHQFNLPPEAYALEPGVDMVSWTSERNGYINKLFVVESVAKTPGMNVLVSLREVDPGDYDWSSGFEMPVEIATPVNPVPFEQVVGGLLVEPAIIKDAASNDRRAAIKVSCDGDAPGVSTIQIQARLNGQADIVIDTNRRFADPFAWFLRDVLPNENYDVSVRLLSDRTPKSVWSPWLTVTTRDVRYGWEDLADSVEQAVADAQAEADQAAEDIQAEVDRATQVEADLAAADQQLRSDFEAADIVLQDQVTNLTASVDGNSAAISDEASIRQSEDALIAGRVSHLESKTHGTLNNKSTFEDGSIGKWAANNAAPVAIGTGPWTGGMRLTGSTTEAPLRAGDMRGRTIRIQGLARTSFGDTSLNVGIQRLDGGGANNIHAPQAVAAGQNWTRFDKTFTIGSGATAFPYWRPVMMTPGGTSPDVRIAWVEITDITDAAAAQATADEAVNVSTDNQQSIASINSAVSAKFNDMAAFVNQTATAIVDVNGFKGAYFGLTAEVQGGDIVGIKGTTWQDPDGSSGSLLKLIGDNVVVPGTLSTAMLSVHDPANLVPDNNFQSDTAWGLPSGPFIRVNSGAAFSTAGIIRYTASQGTGWTNYRQSREFSVFGGKQYYCAVRTNSSDQYNVHVRIVWLDPNGNTISTAAIADAGSIAAGNTYYETTNTAPSNAQKAYIQYRVNQDDTAGNVNIGDLVVRAKEPGSTLITPNSISSNEMIANTITSNEINVGELVGSSAFLNQLVVDTAQINNGAIKSAKIGNLEVDTIKIADFAVTSLEYSFTSGSITWLSGPRINIQSLSYTIGRTGPQTIDLSAELNPDGVNDGQYFLRLIRNGTVIVYYESVLVPSGVPTQFTRRVVDTANLSGSVSYVLEMTATSGTARASKRFIGALNAYK